MSSIIARLAVNVSSFPAGPHGTVAEHRRAGKVVRAVELILRALFR
jgi:hypothetical protein